MDTPAQPPEGDDSLGGLLDFKGVKTFTSEYKTRYAIVAEKKGLSLSIAPKLGIGPLICIVLRVRAQKMEDWANLSDAGNVFGFPELEERGAKHASTDIVVVVGVSPITPYVVGKAIAENKVVEKLIDAIAARLGKAGAETLVEKEALVEYVRNVFEDQIPSDEPKQPDDFPILIGKTAAAKGLTEAAEKYLKQKPKQVKAG